MHFATLSVDYILFKKNRPLRGRAPRLPNGMRSVFFRTRCARLNGVFFSVGSAYVAVDFLCAALESDTPVESLEGPRSS